MKKISICILSLIVLALPLFAGCQPWTFASIKITEIKIAPALDENFMPLNAADNFNKGISKVYCWFSWRDSEANTQIIAKWHYLTQNISIINHSFTLPRKEGAGSVLLTMPEGKTLPSGSYRVDLVIDKHTLRSHKFIIE